ncbi:MAG: glyoxalase [Henriciella sp.]|nr:glyoxalase [Henriciella sp.]
MPPFHLAFPVHDLSAARTFYGELLACPEGRISEHWIDFNFFGHQIVAHLAPDECPNWNENSPEPGSSEERSDDREPASAAAPTALSAATSKVDGKQVPVRHFGLVLDMDTWQGLAARLDGKVEFIIAPYTRFKGQTGEQATMFFTDPSGNAIELKAFANMDQLFAK